MRKLIFLLAILAAAPSFAQNFIPWGGVSSHTTNYTAAAGDIGNLLSMNCSSCTLTLPSPAPYPQWTIMVENVNASTLTIARNGLSIDGAASNITLNQNQGVTITSDGANYFTQRGIGGASGLGDPGSNGIVKRTSLNVTSIAAAADVFSLWTGTCNNTTFLRGDGTCAAAAGVTSFNSRTGAVAPAANDYNFSQIAGATNANALHIGTGGTLDATGTGTITATGLPGATVSTLPGSPTINTLYEVTDALNAGSCATGGGANFVICRWTGASWQAQNTAPVSYSSITAGSSTVAKTEGGAGSLSPVGSTAAQIASNQLWSAIGYAAPTITGTNTGGSINSIQGFKFAYAFNQGNANRTLPSLITSGAANTFAACSSGTACTLTMVAPTIPAGYTGYTMYYCNTNNGPCTNPVDQGNCVNISSNCTITASGAGSGTAMQTVDTADVQPPNLQGTLGLQGFMPSMFVQDTTGNWWTQAGMDNTAYSGTPQTPDGTFTFVRRTWFSDTKTNQGFKNAFVSINHTAGTFTNAAVQDRALGLDLATPASDSATRWGIEVLQAELDLNCNGCNFNGSPDGEEVVFSGQMSDTAATNYTPGTLGPAVARFQYFKSGAGQTSGSVMRVINGIFSLNNVAAVTNGTEAQIYEANCQNTSASLNMDCVALNLDLPGIRHNNGTGAVQIQNGGAAIGGTSPNSQDYVIKNYKHGLVSWLNGPIGLTGIDNTDPQALPVNASLNVTGSINTNQVATNWVAGYTGGCSGGASTYTYQFVAVDNLGGRAPSTSVNVNNCVNPLTGINPITLSPGAGGPSTLTGQAYRQAIRIDVERTAGPMGLGKVGSLTCNTNIPILGCSAFTDTGIVATGTVTTVNTFGGLGNAGDDTFTTGKGQHKNTQAANNDFAGTCTLASATPSTCTVTFTRAYTAAPVCVATNQTTQANPIKAAPTTSNVVFTGPNTVTDVVAYICVGNPN